MTKATLTLIFCLLISLVTNAQTTFQVASQAGSFYPEKNDGKLNIDDWNAISEIEGYKYVMIQFAELPNESTLNVLTQNAIELITYLPKNTYYAKVAANYQANRFEQIKAISVFAPNATHKIHTKIKTGEAPSYAVDGNDYKLMITLYAGIDATKILPSLQQKGATILNVYNQQHITAKINPALIEALASLPAVQFIHFIDAPFEKENILNKTDHRSNNLNSDYGAGRHYDGVGVRVALTDDGTIGPHIDYQGRTIQDAVVGINNGDHGDHCAGIIMSAGNLDPIGRGMAPGCDLWVYEALNSNNYIMNDSIYTSPALSIDIVSTSYSNGCMVGYNAGAESADRQIRTFKNVMRIFSAGNDGTSNCSYGAGAGWGNITGGIKLAKNLIAVANLTYLDALANSSSRGPSTDGRIKPDVSAVGTDVYSTIDPNDYGLKTGTSMSCPGVAGVFAQLYQAYRNLHSGQDPNTGLLKNILMNTCDDIGNPGPDFKHGYGRVNALRAVKILENTQHSRDSVNTGSTKTITLNVPANTQRVKIMLNWMDREAAVAATIALVNDLDLKVTNPSSTVFLPWVLDHTPIAANLNANATRLADHLNNAEQVTIDNPVAGMYTIDVTGFAVAFGPQEYFITYEFIANDAIELTYPIGGEGFVPGDLQTLRWDAISNGSTFDLEYTQNNGSTWTTIGSGIGSTVNYYNWTVPNTLSGNCKVRVSRGAFLSTSPSTFSIMNVPQNLTVTRVCPDTMTISWAATTGATSYEVYQLGNKYMDIIGTTTNTSFDIAGLNSADEHWFSVRSLNNTTNAISRRAYAIHQLPGLLNCILLNDAEGISSLPGNSSLNDCAGASNYLISITLQNNGSTPITNISLSYQVNAATPINEIYAGTIAPNAQHTYTFIAPLAGLNVGTNNIKTWTALPGDQYLANDTLAYSVNLVTNIVATLPWNENFESNAVCPDVPECDHTNCPLLNNLINEQNLVIDDFDWKVNQGPTPTTTTGPDVDHTLGTATGKYIYTETSYCFEQTAFLLTPCFSFTATMKPYLSYWYHLYGNGQGSLHLDAFVDGLWQLDIVTAASGDNGNTWKKQVKDLTAFAGKTVFFRFRGLTGINQRSDMAIDDIGIVDSASGSNSIVEIESSFTVYPNPTSQFIEISATNNLATFDEIELYNTLGAVIYNSKMNTYQSNIKIDVSTYAKGVYWLVLKNKSGIVYKNKVLKN